MKIHFRSNKISAWNFLILTAAGFINAFAIATFLAPVHLFDGGFSGLSMLLNDLTPEYLTTPIFLIAFNLPVFAYGLRKQGLIFTVYSVYTVLIYSLGVYIFNDIIAFDFSQVAGGDLLLCAAFGGLLSGIGSGVTIRFGGAIDGVEVLAVTFAKKIGMTVGTFVMAFNIVVYVIAGICLKSWILPLYSILAYAVGLKTVDFIAEGFDHEKSAVIITSMPDELSEAISDAFNSGVTLLDAKGYFSDEKKTMIYFVVNRYQIEKLKNIVQLTDPSAFVAISEVTDISGANKKKSDILHTRRVNRSVKSAIKKLKDESDSESPDIANNAPEPGLNTETLDENDN